jgi:serine protease Do
VTDRANLQSWVNRGFSASQTPNDAEGGSATPISPDGYFLTADHVLAQMKQRNVFVLYGHRGRLIPRKARVVWRSEASDLALLHIPAATPNYYRWAAAGTWLPLGTSVMHGGIATGFKSKPGKLSTPLAPERFLTGSRGFKIDIPLQPGDSGGPVVDAHGALVGINSAVEFLIPMETAFFVDSEAKRPNIRKLGSIIQRDRNRNITSTAGVE